MLALEWSNPDPLTWRMKLREGVKWQKGFGEFTAEDVVYCWNFHLESKSFQVGTALFPLDSVKADGKYVVEVKTKQPFGAFAGVTMGYGGTIISAKAHKEMGNQAYSATPVGNGAFQIESKRGTEDHPGEESRLLESRLPQARQDRLPRDSRFDDAPAGAGQERARLRHASRSQGGGRDAQERQLRRQVDAGLGVGLPAVQPEGQAPTRPTRTSWCARRSPTPSTARRSSTRSTTARPWPTDNQIPAGYMGYRTPMLKYPKNGDLKKAKELMAQAGVKGYEVEVITSDKDWLRKELELVAAMVSQIGITYKIKNMDMGGYNNLWLNQRFEQVLEDITLVAPDPDATSWWFLHNKGMASGYNSPAMDELLDGARSERDAAKREAMYHKIVDITLDECPLIYHCNTNNIQVFNKNLKGFVPTPQEYTEKLDTVEWG